MLHRGSTVSERQREGQRIRKKLVVVGDGCCGKTAMLMIQSGLPFPTSYHPTIFENFVSSISVNGKLIDLSLWDTAGQEDYDRLRPLSYPCSDVIIMAYAVNNRTSFWSLNDKWKPEMNHFLPDVPKILVGLKKDLRHDPDVIDEMRALCTTPVSYEEGFKKAAEIGARKYFECSAKTGEGVGEIFAYCAKLALLNKKNKAGTPCKVV